MQKPASSKWYKNTNTGTRRKTKTSCSAPEACAGQGLGAEEGAREGGERTGAAWCSVPCIQGLGPLPGGYLGYFGYFQRYFGQAGGLGYNPSPPIRAQTEAKRLLLWVGQGSSLDGARLNLLLLRCPRTRLWQGRTWQGRIISLTSASSARHRMGQALWQHQRVCKGEWRGNII